MGKIKCSDAVFSFLQAGGVTRIFGVPGGGCMHLYESASRNGGLSLVPAFHEQAAGLAAQAYADLTRRLGVCLVTAGPGMTNIVTALAACWIESTPVLFIAGQAKTSDTARQFGVRSLGQQEVDGEAIARPLSKLSIRVESPRHLAEVLPFAVETALSGRPGPVFIEVPLDVQAGELDEAILGINSFFKSCPSQTEIDKHLITQLSDSLFRSRRPAMLIGAGVRMSGAGDSYVRFCERHGIAMLFTWKALQLCEENHPQNFGRPGTICQPYANDVLQTCDWFLSVGARNDLVSVAFDYSKYAENAAQRFFIDIDPAELKKYSRANDVCIQADAGDIVKLLLDQQKSSRESHLDWIRSCGEIKALKGILRYQPPTHGYVSTYHLVDQLSDLLSETHVIVPGSSGSCSDIFMQTFRVRGNVAIQNAPGLGAMGTGLPAISGAHFAFDGARQVVSIIGDGGFQFNLQELQTISNLKINVVIFVLNNNGYASIRRSQKNHFGSNVHTDPSSGIVLTPLQNVAKMFDFEYLKCSNDEQIGPIVSKTISRPGRFIVEVMISPDEDVLPRVRAKLIDGRLVSASMINYQ
jgi:acetolactate synthase-1/2/3 large subunit